MSLRVCFPEHTRTHRSHKKDLSRKKMFRQINFIEMNLIKNINLHNNPGYYSTNHFSPNFSLSYTNHYLFQHKTNNMHTHTKAQR